MSTFAVLYTYVEDQAALDEHRPEHRAFLRSLLADGPLKLSGPLSEPSGGALIVMQAESAEVVLEILDADPFRRAGLIADRVVRPWDVVIGRL